MSQTKLLKHIAAYAVSRGIPGVVALVSLSVFTRLLSTSEYGVYTFCLALAGLANVTIFQWLRLIVGRFLPQYRESVHPVLGPVKWIFLRLCFAVMIGGLVVAAFVAVQWRTLALITTAAVLSLAWYEINQAVANASLRPKLFGKMLVTRTLIAFAVGTLLAYVGFGAVAPLAGLIVGAILAVALVGQGLIWTVASKRPTRELAKSWLSYGLPLTASFGLAWVISASDRLIITSLAGVEMSGLYAPNYDLAFQAVTLVLMIINTAGYPLVMHVATHDDTRALTAQLKQNGEAIFAVAASGAVFFSLFAAEIGTFLLGAEFSAASPTLLPIVAAAAALAGVKAFYFDLAYQVSQQTKWQLVPVALAGTVNVGLNFLLIPSFGLIGAAWATLIGYATAVMVSFIWGLRRFDAMPPLIPILTKAICVSLAFWIGAAGAASLTYGTLHPLLSGPIGGGFTFLGAAIGLNIADVKTTLMSRLRRSNGKG